MPRLQLRTTLLLFGALLFVAGCSLGGDGGDEVAERELTIISDLPVKDQYNGPRSKAMVAAIKATIEARDRRAGPFRIRYVESDFPVFESEQACTGRAERYSKNKQIIAVIGPGDGACARFLIPALNQAGIVAITPRVDYLPGLTHELPGTWDEQNCFECAPGKFYPTGTRNFLRSLPTVDNEGRAAAVLLDKLEAKRVSVLASYAADPILLGFLAEAESRGLNIVEQSVYTSESPSYRPNAQEIIDARPDYVLLLAPGYADGARVLEAIRQGGYDGTIVTSLHIVDEAMLNAARAAAEGVYFTSTQPPLAALAKNARDFVAAIGAQEHALDALYAAEATNAVLDAIAASDGTRPGVRDALFDVTRDGLLGRIAFDGNGDVVPQRIAVFRMQGGELRYREIITVR